MESSHNSIVHTLYSLDYIYSDYNQPFCYRCIVRYCRGKLQLVYPLKWVEAHKTTSRKQHVKIHPSSIRFKEKQLVEELADLLNCDFSGKIQDINTITSDYRTLVESGHATPKTVGALLVSFQDQLRNLHPYFEQSAAKLFRDELIADCYNRYIKEIAEAANEYIVTADYVNILVDNIMQFIDPLLTVTELQTNGNTDIRFVRGIFTNKFRKFLLSKILSCHRPYELPLMSPLQQISDSLRFLEVSCKFLHEYQKELHLFSPDEKLGICVQLFSTDALEEMYCSFCQKWQNLCNMLDSNLMDTLNYIRVRLQSEQAADFHKFLSDGMRLSKSAKQKERQYTMHDFSSIVFLALKEMIANGDANKKDTSGRNSTYIIKCEYCKRYFLPTRSNVIYCGRQAPDSDKTCAEIGAKIRHRGNLTQAVKECETLKKRIAKRISDAKRAGNTKRVTTLKAGQDKWATLEKDYKAQLDSHAISEEEYIEKIDQAFENSF